MAIAIEKLTDVAGAHVKARYVVGQHWRLLFDGSNRPPCHGLLVEVSDENDVNDCGAPYYASVGGEHALRERGTVVGAERAGCVNLVAETREKNLALAFERDLFPAVLVELSRVGRGQGTYMSPSLRSASLSTAMVLADILRAWRRVVRCSLGERRLRRASMARARETSYSVSHPRKRLPEYGMMSGRAIPSANQRPWILAPSNPRSRGNTHVGQAPAVGLACSREMTLCERPRPRPRPPRFPAGSSRVGDAHQLAAQAMVSQTRLPRPCDSCRATSHTPDGH